MQYSKELKELAEYSQNGGRIHRYFFNKKPKLYQDLTEATNFLNEIVTPHERLWYVYNNICTIPKCKTCGNDVNWLRLKRRYTKFCSNKCICRDPDVRNKQSSKINRDLSKLEEAKNLFKDNKLLDIWSFKNRGSVQYIKELTNFLHEKAQIRERLWYIVNNTDRVPKCKTCNNSVKWDNIKKNLGSIAQLNV